MSEHHGSPTTLARSNGPATSGRPPGCPLDMKRRLLMGFLEQVRQAAHLDPSGAPADVDRLRRMAEDYLAEVDAEAAASPEACISLHAAVLWEDRRHKPFERVLTRRFAPLLPLRAGDEGSPAEAAPLSRRLIPGLMTALGMMAGRERLEAASAAMAGRLERHREARLGLVDWTALAAEAETQQLIADLLMACVQHFQPFERRATWLMMIINNHLPPPLPEDRDPAWRCTPDRAVQVLQALYSPLREQVHADGGAALAERHGPDAVAGLRLLLDALDTAVLAA